MSRRRTAGLVATHSSTCAWFVTNRQRCSDIPEPSFTNGVTVVLSPVLDHLFERIPLGGPALVGSLDLAAVRGPRPEEGVSPATARRSAGTRRRHLQPQQEVPPVHSTQPLTRGTNGAPIDPDGRLEVAVVGGGQAGLAIGHHLARAGRRFVILEAGESVGTAWRERWDSLVLFTPRRYDALPGLAFPGDPDGHPGRDEVVGYLERYAQTFDLPVRFRSRVRSLRAGDGGGFVLELDDDRRVEADQVVVATGPSPAPPIPALAGELDPELFQAHSAASRTPNNVPAGTVLVVGGGNTGFQIAKELSATHTVHLAIGSRQTPLPQRLLGRDLFWWLTRLGLLAKTVDSRVGRRGRNRDTLVGSSPRELVRRFGVAMKPRAVGASGRTVRFGDGSQLDVDAVVWATGYRPDHSWIDVDITDENGQLRHRRGLTDMPGLYFLGLSWQHTRGSALLGFVKDDAEFIAGSIEAAAATTPSPAPAPHSAGAPMPQAGAATEGN